MSADAIQAALDPVRRRLRAHAGDVELVSVSEDGEVTLAFTGTCVACPAQAMTFGTAILPALERVPGVSKVSARGMTVSATAMRRIRAMFGS